MINFCQHCGSAVEKRIIEGRQREVCPVCGTVFYHQWKVSAGVRVVNDGQLLLVQRGIDPWRGMWHMPAGYVEADELPRAAAEREAREETGLNVQAGELVDCYLETSDPRGNVIVLLYDAVIVNGEMIPSCETESVGFFTPEEISALPLAGLCSQKEIDDWLNSSI